MKTDGMVLGMVLVGLAGIVAACQMTQEVPEYNGAMLYQGYCASCHGPAGRGDGPVALELTVFMEDLRTITARNDGVFPRQSIEEMIEGSRVRVAHGTPDMPVWGWAFYVAEQQMGETEPQKFAAARITALTNYLEGIQTEQ